MNDDKKDAFVPGAGFLFTPDGLRLAEMAIKLHEQGYLTDEEMAQDGGVPALRRKLYDELSENRHHYSKFKTSPSQLTEVDSARQAQDKRLMLAANEYAIALGVRDPKYLTGIVAPEDLEAFGIEINGKNIVDAELVAKAIQADSPAFDDLNAGSLRTMLRTIEMVRWILAGRPDRDVR